MPPVIVVSVPNHFDDGVNSRDHDLTPSVQPHEAHSGGAAQFTAFLKNELIPYVKKRYPSNGVNLVHGHSYGGLFLAYVIANDPGLFDGYMLLDPAMWWNDKEVPKALEEKLPGMPTQRQSRLHRRPRRTRVQRHGRGFAADRVRESAEGSAVESGRISGRIARLAEVQGDLRRAAFHVSRLCEAGPDTSTCVPTRGIVAPGKPLMLESTVADVRHPLHHRRQRADARVAAHGSRARRFRSGAPAAEIHFHARRIRSRHSAASARRAPRSNPSARPSPAKRHRRSATPTSTRKAGRA